MLAARVSVLALALCCSSSLAAAQDEKPSKPEDEMRAALELFKVETGIERNLLLGQMRGMLGPRPPKADWTPRRSGKGRLERGPGGVPILYVEGTPEEIGAQHGALLKNEIRALRSYVKAFVGPRRYAKGSKQAEALFSKHLPERYARELAAMAKASGTPLSELRFAQWFTDLYRGFACSTVAGPSAEGTLLARNLDFPNLGYLQRYSVVIVARPKGKRPFVSITWPGLVGVLSGQNKSLAAAVMVVHDAKGARSGLPFQLAFRRVLEDCDDVAEAEALLRKTPLTVTNNLMLADAQGDVSVLELHPEKIVARGPDDRGLVMSTNHFQSRERAELRASFTFFNSLRRLRSVEGVCKGEGPLTLGNAKRALREASVVFTTQSMVFFPEKGEVELAFVKRGPAAKGKWVRLSRKVLLGSE